MGIKNAPMMGMMGVVDGNLWAVCGAPHQPSDCLAIYRDARQQLPFRFPLQIEVQSSVMGRGQAGGRWKHWLRSIGFEALARIWR